MRNLSDSRMMMTRRLHHLVLLCTCLTIPLLHAQTAETVPTPEQYDFIAAQIERDHISVIHVAPYRVSDERPERERPLG